MEALEIAWCRRALATGAARRWRIKARLSLTEAASAGGVSKDILSRWERGISAPNPENALRYGAFLRALQPRSKKKATS